jgi:succinate dehydrogenase/fumarate reductase flavoprotein subunit
MISIWADSPALRRGGSMGYTAGMKTAISLPDDVFREAERQARRTRKSRSQLYAEALSEYLARHAPEEVTEAMNRVVDQLRQPTDPFVSAAARHVLERSEW